MAEKVSSSSASQNGSLESMRQKITGLQRSVQAKLTRLRICYDRCVSGTSISLNEAFYYQSNTIQRQSCDFALVFFTISHFSRLASSSLSGCGSHAKLKFRASAKCSRRNVISKGRTHCAMSLDTEPAGNEPCFPRGVAALGRDALISRKLRLFIIASPNSGHRINEQSRQVRWPLSRQTRRSRHRRSVSARQLVSLGQRFRSVPVTCTSRYSYSC